jgi:hypothetical protein
MKQIKNLSTSNLLFAAALALTACGNNNAPANKPVDVTPPQSALQPATEPSGGKPADAAKADPDAELAAKIKSAFANDPDLKMLPIDIRASNGAVTLYGTADSAKLRDKAVNTASKVDGVKSVSNNLQIVKGS